MICKIFLKATIIIFLLYLPCRLTAFSLHNDEDIIGTVPVLLQALNPPGSLSSESVLGSTTADAVRLAAEADIAVLNGGDFTANLQPGQASWGNIISVFSENRRLGFALISPHTLQIILEEGVSHIELDEAEKIDREKSVFTGFPQISGFTFTYDASAPAGERIVSVKLSNGEVLNPEDNTTQIKLAATVKMLEGGYGFPVLCYSNLNLTLADALAKYAAAGISVPVLNLTDRRITVLGTTEYNIFSIFPSGLAIAIFIIILLLASRGRFKTWLDFER